MPAHPNPLDRLRSEIGETPTGAPAPPSHRHNRWLWGGAVVLAGVAAHQVVLVVGGAMLLAYLLERGDQPAASPAPPPWGQPRDRQRLSPETEDTGDR